MLKLKIFQVDAFTDQIFSGNPACVVPLKEWLNDDVLLKIAKENAVAETAFYLQKENDFHLRWFTPEIEMDLCGHATLATAHVIFSLPHYSSQEVRFQTISGLLHVNKTKNLYTLDFPSRPVEPSKLPEPIMASLSLPPRAVFKARDYLLLYDNEKDIAEIRINRVLFDQINLDPGGVIVTAKGKRSDFVSRFFTPQASILEDPVTGSAHCSLIPFWAERLQKTTMQAQQISARGGNLLCQLKGNRTLISGKATTYLHGFIEVPIA